ncbi:MAG: hypothetical protein A2147_04100 [Chloroflexi bacterium RBG_16_57_8]|nr:MAG: hypothetical protein A2147_04100 [Chloroflexi bacterium RBG_16_57_8]
MALWIMMPPIKSAIWDSFLSGYTEAWHLGAADLAAVPLFYAISHLWVLGIRASKVAAGCSVRISNRSFDRELTFFREWEADHLVR